jgi:hypothetical protein
VSCKGQAIFADTHMSIDDLKVLIGSKLDVMEFLDIVGYDLCDLVEIMEDEIEEHWTQLLDACS